MTDEQVRAVAQESCLPEAWVRQMVNSKKWPAKPADFLALIVVPVRPYGEQR